MTITQIMIDDPMMYLTTGTYVDKGAGTIAAVGVDGSGVIEGSDWYVDTELSAVSGYVYAFREQKIDIQGLEMKPIACLAMDFIQSEAPSAFSKTKGYMRDMCIISTSRLSRNQLIQRIGLFTAPLPFNNYRPGGSGGAGNLEALITKEQSLAGRSQLFSSDVSLAPTLGFLRQLSNFNLNMGNEVSCDALYYYRVMYYFADYNGTSDFFWDNAARTTILTLNVREDADDTQIATGMIRAYQAPGSIGGN